MKLKFLLFLTLIAGVLNAQDTIRSLVITEAFIGRQFHNFAEITNMGNEPVNLSQFKFGQAQDNAFNRNRGDIILPDIELQPGESFILKDFVEWMVDIPPEPWNVNEREMMGMNTDWRDLVDQEWHRAENSWGEELSPLDSVTETNWIANWWGRSALFIEQQINDTTAVIVDQVGGVWDNPNGNGRQRGLSYEDSYDVAGYQNATSQAQLIRKFSVKTGNKEFVRGVGIDDSEWFAVRYKFSPNRMLPWTLGNHGDYNLDANTLVPTLDGLEVDFAAKTITVPWGVRKPDGIMANMEEKPGVTWYYHMNDSPEDSLTYAVKTGDKLEIVVAGVDLDRDTFDIIVSEPTASDNMVVPGIKWDPEGDYMDDIWYNFTEWPIVTEHDSGMDTIRGYKTQRYEWIPDPDYYYGIPYATRVDTLTKLLEKPDNATWEIVYVDGMEQRADLKNGDILKVTAENGDVKEYYIKVDDYRPSSSAELSAITWPDIPQFYKGLFGWKGDTIPNFVPFTTDYILQVPQDVEGIPALVAKTMENNTKVEVTRATDLYGSVEDKTVTFKVIAEDDTTFRFYNVQLEKEKMPDNVEPNQAEPFFSMLINSDQFGNSFLEITNPGNQPLDLSNYMIVENYANADPAAAITKLSEADDWMNRFAKYVPGYKWVDQGTWSSTPARLTQDLAVNAIVAPGDVFVMGEVQRDEVLWRIDPNFDWWLYNDVLDVQFRGPTDRQLIKKWNNPWGEELNAVPLTGWSQSNLFMFKILNDSVKDGTKPATDPADFELIETWGMPDGSNWTFSDPQAQAYGNANIASWVRKPEFTKPKSVMGESFGVTGDSICEWVRHNGNYWRDQGIPSPLHQAYTTTELGSHFFVPPTDYLSTVGSSRYKVSRGYGAGQEISGVVTGTTANEFLGYIIKYDEGQALTLLDAVDGTELEMDAALETGNVLHVMSADSVNTTEYSLMVSETGLSSNAVLTSERYDIEIQEQPKNASDDHMDGEGTISGMEYGTLLSTVVNNVEVPEGATMTIIDSEGAYVPLKTLDFDTAYVGTVVSTDIYFEVVAEDKVTKIDYQLVPVATEDDAFLTSNVYDINQAAFLISNVPGGEYVPGGGMNVSSFLDGLTPSKGATMMVVDKFGLERNDGQIYQDDKVVVTSPSGAVTNVYFISFLPTRLVPKTTYLAYVLSNFYEVDQVFNVIKRPDEDVNVDVFLSRIRASEGANAVVVDMNGEVKTSGELAASDQVLVVSQDGMVQVYYDINLATSSRFVNSGDINLYPNPTNGNVNISGLETGGRIRVFNTAGTAIRDISVNETIETVSLSDQPAGMYLIVVSDNHKLVGRYKVIRK